MNKTLAMSVTPEQYDIIKRIADSNKCSVSKVLKDSVQMYIAMYYVGEMLSKVGFTQERTMETIERDAEILMHAEGMVNAMRPYLEQAFYAIPPEVIKALEEKGKDLTETMKKYNKPVKRGRPPALTVNIQGDT